MDAVTLSWVNSLDEGRSVGAVIAFALNVQQGSTAAQRSAAANTHLLKSFYATLT